MNEDKKKETINKTTGKENSKNYGIIGSGVILPVTKLEGQRLEEGNGNWMYAANKGERR